MISFTIFYASTFWTFNGGTEIPHAGFIKNIFICVLKMKYNGFETE